ncbi:MAG: T9SS type A sorting domain-containing protein [Flavobacterium sp.]|nr:T9SS type A sorting domain-containing protein [Flavobacterium sp.]
MKTKLLFTLMIIFTLAGTLSSQEYHPLLNNSSWNISYTGGCCDGTTTNTLIYQTGQEVHDGFLYTRFSDSPALFREDVVERKVYVRGIDGIDKIVFDFSLELGDSVLQPNGYVYFVTAIEYIDLTGGTRKRMTMTTFNNSNGFYDWGYWIEGVGNNQSPFKSYMYRDQSAGANAYMNCSFQNGEVIYGDGSCAALLTTAQNEFTNQTITFSPNPFITALTIQSEITLDNARVKIFNAVGQLVREMNTQSGKTIVLGFFLQIMVTK